MHAVWLQGHGGPIRYSLEAGPRTSQDSDGTGTPRSTRSDSAAPRSSEDRRPSDVRRHSTDERRLSGEDRRRLSDERRRSPPPPRPCPFPPPDSASTPPLSMCSVATKVDSNFCNLQRSM